MTISPTPSPLRIVSAFLLACTLTTVSRADQPAKPRLAPTPPMGWNSWEAFRREFTEDTIKAQADAMVSTGLRDAGYTYLVIDGGWKPSTRGPNDVLIEDPAKFPHGMKAVADYVHSKGLKFGLHQPAGIHDCPKLSPGSQNFEDQDAALFAQWGVDFIKYDLCDYVFTPTSTPGSPDFDRFVLRQGDKTLFSTEAEAVQNQITGLARVEPRPGCSGGRVVAGIGYDHAAITIPDVTAPADGKYSLDIHLSLPYFGQGNRFRKVTFFLTVNDAPPVRIDLPYTLADRYTHRLHTVDVTLKAGHNTITVDNPSSQEEEIRVSYAKMASALNRTGHPIVFSSSGAQRPWLWAQNVAHLYRTTSDVVDRWSGQGATVTAILDRHIPLMHHAAPGYWPDPDMLEVGHKDPTGRPTASNPSMTDDEYRAQFSLWSIMNAPLFISMDLRKLDDAAKKVLLNKDVIAINQDPLAAPCKCIRSDGDLQILAKPLADGSTAVAFLNRGPTPTDAQLPTADLGLQAPPKEARDLWTAQVTPVENGVIHAHIPTHAVVLLRIK